MTSATTPKTIELYTNGGVQHEAAAVDAIMPGMLVERAATGVQTHSVAGGIANLHFANEYPLTGGTIDDEYEIGDQVIFTTYAPGDGVYALLAAGNDASVGDLLVSNGDGALAYLVPATGGVVVAQAMEAVNNDPGTGGAAVRIQVEVMAATYVAPVGP